MSHHTPRPEDAFLTRRDLLRRSGMGFGTLGLAGVLADAGDLSRAARADATDLHPLAPKRPHFAPKAQRVVHLFMNGGPSQVDTFDGLADAVGTFAGLGAFWAWRGLTAASPPEVPERCSTPEY